MPLIGCTASLHVVRNTQPASCITKTGEIAKLFNLSHNDSLVLSHLFADFFQPREEDNKTRDAFPQENASVIAALLLQVFLLK